jgi:hypothetical protein
MQAIERYPSENPDLAIRPVPLRIEHPPAPLPLCFPGTAVSECPFHDNSEEDMILRSPAGARELEAFLLSMNAAVIGGTAPDGSGNKVPERTSSETRGRSARTK